MTRRVVGIDLGTTYSLVSHLATEHPYVIPNALGELLTPSAVSVDDDGTLLVGAAARARAVTHPAHTQLAFKRDMGTDRTYTLADRTFTPVELSAMVLAALRSDAEAVLGGSIEEAVITVPAYFGERQRQATRDAATIAGLRVERMVNEPTAAALAYGMHQRHRNATIAVLDLGGGTFDVTVLAIIDGVIEVQGSAGDARLGGEDFVDAIVGHARAHLASAYGGIAPELEGQLREACELAKRRLSTENATEIVLPQLSTISGRTVDVAIPIDRVLADRLFAPWMERMRAPILRALSDAKRAPADLDEVLLVGGATRMTQVAQLAARMLGRMPLRKLPPDEAVALGAAVQAALVADHVAVEDVIATDVAPFTLGIATSEIVGQAHVDGLFVPVLERGTTIPASRVRRFYALGSGQREVEVVVYQGEHSLCRDNTRLAAFRIGGLPSGPRPSIDVRFTYDPSGLLEVDVEVTETGAKHHHVVEERPGKLSPAEVAKVGARLRALKFHARDALPNRTLLARAEALFTQLQGAPRDMIGILLRDFRVALEVQDPQLVAQTFARLSEAVAQRRT